MTESPKVPGTPERREPVDPNTLPLCPRGCGEGVSVSQEGGLDEPVWVHCDNLECSWNAALEDWNRRATAPSLEPMPEAVRKVVEEMRAAKDESERGRTHPLNRCRVDSYLVGEFADRLEAAYRKEPGTG